MVSRLLVLAIGSALSVSAFASSSVDSKAAAINAFKNSDAVKAAAAAKCGGRVMNQKEPVAALLHEDDVVGQYYPILVIQEIGCTFTGESVAAIVKTATRIDQQTAKLVYDTQDPTVVDLGALAK